MNTFIQYCYTTRSDLPVLAVAAAILAAFLVLLSQSRNKKEQLSRVRKEGETSHILIQTADAKQSAQFLVSFGLFQKSSFAKEEGDNKYVILSCPNRKNNKHQPLVVLEETSGASASKRSCSDQGIGRICLGVKNVFETVKYLEDECGLRPQFPPVCANSANALDNEDRTGLETVVACYRDPTSGAVLELLSLKPTLALKVVTWVAEALNLVEFPFLMHACINVPDFRRGMAAYQALGYTTTTTHISQQYSNPIFAALGITNIANEVGRIKTSNKPFFFLDLIEWAATPTEVKCQRNTAATTSHKKSADIRIAHTVTDLSHELDKLLSAGRSKREGTGSQEKESDSSSSPLWTLVEAPKLCSFPSPLGKAAIATIRHEHGIEVDVVEYQIKGISCQ